ncbi:MAG: Cadherin, partial [Labilithrix sp.]|nr:Cadherin [Labilithrix sp.]
SNWTSYYTGRVVQALDVRSVTFAIGSFPSTLAPATGKTRVSQGKYVFNDLPASLQKRFRYDPLSQKLEFSGFVNDKAIGDNTLTAAPSAVYVLEPNILNADDVAALKSLATGSTAWIAAIDSLAAASKDPNGLNNAAIPYAVGLAARGTNGVPARSFGPGLALVPNDGLLNPTGKLADGVTPIPAESWITVVENNDLSLDGSPITPHIIKVDRTQRYRGSIKTILSDNVFDENVVLRHTGDFGTKAGDLYFEWYYRPDDGSLNVPPPDLLKPGTTNPWKLFPDPTGRQGLGRYEITLKGNPNAPETLLADSWWFVRYRHKNDVASGTNWLPNNTAPTGTKKYDWAGAGNSDPLHDFDLDGVLDYRAQLSSGWIKRVLDAVNPYEARIRNFEGENPATISSMISQFGPRYEGPVALNPAKDVIENVGLIELYETILNRGKSLSIDLSQPVSTPAISNALQLASTRLADFYTLLGNEAYTDAQDPTIGFGSDSVDYGSLAPAVFAFENQQPDLISEELSLLHGVDDYFARPVYNRLFWNFTKGEGEAAYAMNYNISDVNQDGFINEADAMKLYPMGHGDAWGHYLTALKYQYNLLRQPYFNWVSRAESYNLQDITITVDFLDERKFASTAAAKAKAGAEIVNLTYRDKFVESPEAQWQGYTDTNADRAWGVDEWSRRAGQGAYFDWITANALLPSEHPNTTLEGVRKVDRENNSDIAVISANLSAIQTTMDNSNRGQNPLGLSRNALVFDIDPTFLEVGSTAQIGTRAVQGLLHFDQIYERSLKMLENAQAIWDNANESRNMLRQLGNSETEFRNATFQEDLSYRNQLIQIFGKPYPGTVGPGKIYP